MRFTKHILTSAVLSVLTINAFAVDVPKIHHPIQIIKTPKYMYAAPYGLSPKQMKKAYGLDQIMARGKGQIIAIIAPYDDPAIESDLATFDKAFNLPECSTANGQFKKIFASGAKPQPDPSKSWPGEVALDVEWAHAMAPMAKIYLVESDDEMSLYKAVSVAVASGANIVSMSFGAPEGPYVKLLNFDQYFQAPNVTFIASSGDAGHQKDVSYPASSPYVLAVGGTSLTVDSAGNRLAETAWVGSGGGVSTIEAEGAAQKAYPIPNNPTQMRGVPDVSYFAAATQDGNPTGVAVYTSIAQPGETPGWQIVGGTSAGAPQWAGIIARANSIAQKSIPVASIIYKIAKASAATSFYDITRGNNGNCSSFGHNPYYCQAQIGYDYITGLGSPHARDIIDKLVKG